MFLKKIYDIYNVEYNNCLNKIKVKMKKYLDFKETTGFILPNVSHCIQENHVHYNPLVDPYNGHAYVDLGLPSGTKWAKMNVGASSETDAGLYFAWGETQGYTASQVSGSATHTRISVGMTML